MFFFIIISDEKESADGNQAIKTLEFGYLSRSEVADCLYKIQYYVLCLLILIGKRSNNEIVEKCLPIMNFLNFRWQMILKYEHMNAKISSDYYKALSTETCVPRGSIGL